MTSPKTRDASTRAQEREGGLPLHVILREGHDVLPGYTSARDLPIPDSERQWPHTRDCECLECQPAPADPLDTVRLLAFLGHEEARELVTPIGGRPWGWWDDRLLIYPQDWAGKLTRLADKLPPHRLEGRWVVTTGEATEQWSDTPLDTPARRWLLAVAAHAAARACLRLEPDPAVKAHLDRLAQIEQALDACAAWIAEPTPEREEAWALAHPGLGLFWTPAPRWREGWATFSESFLAASEVIGGARVREVASQAVTRVVLP